ncbi:BgTH12-06642 [Blumeria graminis f. sp. triticale]|uniref:BgtA-20060 n=2 Tax=Blumeria graminis TaxID=34373 RepID=A0A9X9PSB2_BLUGR|nr:BgTH12-06642 [Blumeria graminis f. sp. triticale]VCU41239.1 BgtA-20060 [Blumeria graminis f. sp. tritici]
MLLSQQATKFSIFLHSKSSFKIKLRSMVSSEISEIRSRFPR